MNDILERARNFIYRNARPLDLARFQFHFEGGSSDEVIGALSAYQNEDGGFGFALEPDCWNEKSTPLQTWAATRFLEEISYSESSSEIIQGILSYLCSGKEFEEGLWHGLNDVKSNDDYPHAPWWGYAQNKAVSYNPTANLAGFILKHSNKGTAQYAMAEKIVVKAYDYIRRNAPLESIHEAACFVELFDYLDALGTQNIVDLPEFKSILQDQIDKSIISDVALWDAEYVCKPSFYIKDRASHFFEANEQLCLLEKQHIIDSQNLDGTWNVTWEWGGYPEEWSISKNWWKSDIIINNLKFIKSLP